MSKTTTTTPEATTPDRTLAILEPISPTGQGVIRITETVKGKTTVQTYRVTCFPAYSGEAIGLTWHKDDGDHHNACINGKRSTCDCPWGTYGADKKPCRHVAAGLKLQAMGELRLPIQEEESEENDFDLAELALSWDTADCY